MPACQSERALFEVTPRSKPSELIWCRSCFTRYSPSTLVMEVVAYKDIEPGEELTLSCEFPSYLPTY